jgi:hypothetical protein
MPVAPRDLAHVFWIGGSPCSGKTSIAEALAEAYTLQLYHADQAYFRHANVVTPERLPIFHKLVHLSADELWMRSVEEQVAEEVMLYQEEFPLILDDLLALPATRPILAEGAALLPESVVPFLRAAHHAIWIVPTPTFQVTHYAQRTWAQEVVAPCADPRQAFENWMQRDIRFAEHVKHSARRVNMRTLVVDGGCSLGETTAIVERHFQLGPVIP